MLSRQGLKAQHKRALGLLRLTYPSARSASIVSPDPLNSARVSAFTYDQVPLHLLDSPRDRSQDLLHQFQSPRFSATRPSAHQILAKSDETDPVDPPKPKRERKKRDQPAEKNDGGEKPDTVEKPEHDKSNKVTSDTKSTPPSSSQTPPAAPPPSNNDDPTPPPLPPRVKTPNDQKGSPTEKLYQSASAADKEQVMILPINRRPLIPGKFTCIVICIC